MCVSSYAFLVKFSSTEYLVSTWHFQYAEDMAEIFLFPYFLGQVFYFFNWFFPNIITFR